MDLKSGYPFWLVQDGLLQIYPKLNGDTQCNVVVVGAGITGALVAHHLVAAGLNTVVIDRRDAGWGSTAASTALLQYELDILLADLSKMHGPDRAARAYLACRDAIDKLECIAHEVPGAFGFERKKSLYLASGRRDHEALRTEFGLRRAIGIEVDWLEADDIAARFPFRRPAALLSHNAAQVDPYAFTHALLRNGVRRGLRVFDRTAVAQIESTRRGITVVTPEKHRVRAHSVVFATGYETQCFLKPIVARLVSTYALASEPAVGLEGWGEDECVIWEHAHPYLYLRTTADGRVIVGGEDESFRDPDHRDRLLPRKTKALAKRFRAMFPAIELNVAFAWAGTFGETEDGLAYIGPHAAWPNAYFALGYGGNGITFGLIAAEIIRDAVLGRPNEQADLFRFDR